MKNVYDILVNFKKNAYEFYEWNKNDDIEHIKMIPSFKVKDDYLLDFTLNNIKVDKKFLSLIEGKTEVFSNRLVKIIDYACIIFNDSTALALEFDNSGLVIGKSKLLFDEADDVITSGYNLDEINMHYEIMSKTDYKNKYTRKESNMILMLCKYLDSVYNKRNDDEIKYMYFECFNDNEQDEKKAYEKLKDSIRLADFEVMNKLRTLIKVLKK